MSQRFSIRSVLSAHWKGLSEPSEHLGGKPIPDRAARCILILVPVLAAVAVGGFRIPLSSPAIVVAALSLLTGSLLTVFTQLSTLRLKLTEWYDRDDIEHRTDKDAIDESVAHVLTAALIALTATFVAVGATVLGDKHLPVINGIIAAIVVGLVAYVLLLLIILIPRLYSAYVAVHDVDDNLNGQVVDRTDKPMRRLRPDR
ncbi:hypothetical protein [Gordonia tangerina]|uniref:Uncharacterized protein n=1 Tax=Gordonia tangerina TaxID=2911060 RepID=A0ABS9DFU6_9ACTN|nr:hypothetical protein [Gordonia tangerina]MCF3937169.1 hypothetical protein [Gordonia tangerina]